MKQRLQKVLAQAGVASRRAAESLIVEGRVTVDGVVVTELGTAADAETQEIRVDGARVRAGRSRRYLALNKPVGYVTTRNDPGRRKTVMELLPLRYQNLFPVGRLDMGSSGLLVMTDDGELAQHLTHPRYGVDKIYLVTVKGLPTEATLTQATRGVFHEGERLVVDRAVVVSSRPARDDSKSRTVLRVTLRQGRNREIRRLFGALGHTVVELLRERVGPLSLRGLPSGAYRVLTAEEVSALRARPGDARPKARGRRSRAK